MRIRMISIPVPDPVNAHEFYTNTLGFKTHMFIPESNLAIVVSEDEPDGCALLLEPNQNPVSSAYQKGLYRRGLPIVVFGVTDIVAEHHRLANQGVKFIQYPVQRDWGMEAVFDDGFGNLIQMVQNL